MTMRVLIVDDSAATRFLLRDFMELSGHQVVEEAESKGAALDAYARHKPDVVTLDLSLADEDGLSVLKSLRALDAKAKVLVISGNTQEKVRESVYEAGAAGFLSKPIDFEGLKAAIARVVP